MELKEKLDGFYRAAMGAAEEQSHTMLDKYRKEYEGKIAEYRQAKERERRTEGDGRKGACAQGDQPKAVGGNAAAKKGVS